MLIQIFSKTTTNLFSQNLSVFSMLSHYALSNNDIITFDVIIKSQPTSTRARADSVTSDGANKLVCVSKMENVVLNRIVYDLIYQT